MSAGGPNGCAGVLGLASQVRSKRFKFETGVLGTCFELCISFERIRVEMSARIVSGYAQRQVFGEEIENVGG